MNIDDVVDNSCLNLMSDHIQYILLDEYQFEFLFEDERTSLRKMSNYSGRVTKFESLPY